MQLLVSVVCSGMNNLAEDIQVDTLHMVDILFSALDSSLFLPHMKKVSIAQM